MKRIFFVFNSSPMLGRGAPTTGFIFSGFKEIDYINKVNEFLQKSNIDAILVRDDTEANIEIIQKYADGIICAPGLKFQFYKGSFSKEKILYLTSMEFYSFDITRPINFIKKL